MSACAWVLLGGVWGWGCFCIGAVRVGLEGYGIEQAGPIDPLGGLFRVDPGS